MLPHIPDDATPEEIEHVLEKLVWDIVKHQEQTNLDECIRLRGTPGEPIPKYTFNLKFVLRLVDSAEYAPLPGMEYM